MSYPPVEYRVDWVLTSTRHRTSTFSMSVGLWLASTREFLQLSMFEGFHIDISTKYRFMQGAGPALGSVFGGLVVDATNNWRWTMWLNAIPCGVCVLLVIFLIPETNFRRSAEATKTGMTPTQFSELRRTLRLSNRQALGLTGWYDRYALHGFEFRPTHILLTEAGKLPSGPFSSDRSFYYLFRPSCMLLSPTA